MSRRIAIVTGAGTGVGRAVASELVDQGWHVAYAGRREAVLRDAAAGADPEGGRSLVVPTDVTDAEQVTALFDRVVAQWGRVDLLFNNAGTVAPAVPLDEVDPATWRAVVDVNLSGMFYGMQAAFRVMKAQEPRGGRIINNGSISAMTPRLYSAPYTATKHGVLGLTKAGALDGRTFDIAVGEIDIGNAATDMTERMATGVLQADGTVASEPVIDARDVAKAVAYMADLPLDTNVLTMTVMASKMPFVGRG